MHWNSAGQWTWNRSAQKSHHVVIAKTCMQGETYRKSSHSCLCCADASHPSWLCQGSAPNSGGLWTTSELHPTSHISSTPTGNSDRHQTLQGTTPPQGTAPAQWLIHVIEVYPYSHPAWGLTPCKNGPTAFRSQIQQVSVHNSLKRHFLEHRAQMFWKIAPLSPIGYFYYKAIIKRVRADLPNIQRQTQKGGTQACWERVSACSIMSAWFTLANILT